VTSTQATSMPDWWQLIRQQMPVVRQWAYFDHAAVAPLSEPARVVVHEWADHFTENGVVDWNRWRQKIEGLRELAAARLRADQSEIALIRNTTEGITLVAEGFPWQAGDNVVVPDSEFPSNLYPWMHLADRGVEVRQVHCPEGRIEPASIERACNDRTRIIAVSWVGYGAGWRADLEALAEIAHARDAFLFVDAIQGLGVLDLDVTQTPIDALAADGHKWLLGPEGAGIMYIRQSCLDRLRPLGIGWNSVVQAGNFSDTSLRIKPDASRYEGGTHNMVGFLGLAASMSMFTQHSGAEIEQRLRYVTDLCCERLQSAGATLVSERAGGRWSGILALDIPRRSPLEVKKDCLRQQVVVNARNGHVRISPHVYTSADDVERLIGALFP
jgi:cysteine desulfurase / selenocysteine lyase